MSLELRTVFGPLPSVVRGENVLLGGDYKNKKNFLYTCGKNVVIRDLENPKNCTLYYGHKVNASVARYSPSGFYICSADVAGNIRIWDAQSSEHSLKAEYCKLNGRIKDLQWSNDSQRIVVCGSGRTVFGAAIMWDSGNSVGEISGHEKPLNTIDCRASRPFRVITGGDDNLIGFHAAFPVKISKLLKNHSRYVLCLRFSPSGEFFASAGADGRVFLFRGDCAELVREMGSPAHQSSVMCLSWSPEGDMLLTASTDKTCKIWNVVSGAEVCQFLMGSSIEDQQLGCLWQGETLISVALGGWINYLDRNNPSTPKRMLYGHMKNISGLCLGKNGSTFYSACQGGLICVWNIDTAVATIFKGPKHKTAVCDVLICENKIVSADQNRIICFSPADGDGSACVSLECSSTPVSMDCKGGTIGLACVSHIDIYREGKKQHSVSVSYSPASAAVHPNGETIAIGGKDQKIHVYHLKDGQLAETRTISLYGEVTTLKYSSDGRYLASGDSSSYVCLLPTDTYEVKDNRWTNHTTKITCLDWSPDSRCLVTGGVDCQVIVWSLENPKRPVMVPRAHTDNVTKVVFVDERTVLTAGYDCAIKLWDIKNTSTL